MAGRDRILERERRQMEQILELDMEELQVEEVDGDGSSSSSDVDTFLRNTHGDGGITTSEELMVDTSTVSLQADTYLEAKIGAQGKFSFLDGDRVLNLPMFYLQGVVLFPEASLRLRVSQPRLVEAIDKAINHVDAPCMIGVVYVYRHTNDGHYTIASVGTISEIQEIQQLDDGSSCIFSHGQQRFRLMRHWLDVDGVPWGEVQIIEEDTPQRTPRDAFGQLAGSNSFRQCASSIMPSLHVSCSTQLDHLDSDMDRDSLSTTSTSSDHSVTDKRIYLLGSRSSGLVRCGIVDESSNEGQNSIPEQSCQSHEPVKEIDGYGQPDKNTNTGDEDNLCFTSSKSFQRARKKDTKQQKHYLATKNASQAPLSFWPRWAYEMYDSYSLSRRAADLWRQVILYPSMDDHVRKLNYLSFCIGSKLPISESLRQELLEIDGISYRLQREIQLLKAFNIIRCRNCLTLIARRSDMVVTSSDSPMSSHSKPHSFVKEIITVYNATGLALRGDPSKTHSWFPEYTWTIALCSACKSNIGWLFRVDNKNLHPRSFWAILPKFQMIHNQDRTCQIFHVYPR